MWIRKVTRDRAKGVDSPMPTQVVSNEEFTPRRQNEAQKKVEYLIGEMATERSAKLGIDRKSFLRSTMGMARSSTSARLIVSSFGRGNAPGLLRGPVRTRDRAIGLA